MSDFGIYVHWPFCASKCPYCDFNSHVRAGGIDEARFLAAYRRELAHWAARRAGGTVTSVFFGGGTPSLMGAGTVGAILDTVASHWRVDPAAEITLEANPSSVEAARFRGYRAAGVNRVSLGVQSFDDAELKALGRLHTAAEAKAGIDVARETFERFTFDLIYARPRQSPEAWRRELGEALSAGRPAPVALPAHHRAGHAVRPAACGGPACGTRPRRGAGLVRDHPGDDRAGGTAGLRDLQPRGARRGKPAQPALLALRRICGRRRGRARPPRAGGPAACDRHRAAARALDRARGEVRPRRPGDDAAQPRRAGR